MTGVWNGIHWLDGLIVGALFLIVLLWLIWAERR